MDIKIKKSDIIITLITGEGVAWLFVFILKNSSLNIPYLNIILPVIFPVMAIFGFWISFLIGKKFLFVFQLVKFLMIGALFALFDLLILNGLMIWLGVSEEQKIKYSIFVGVSFIIATTVKYVADKFWVFKKNEKEKMGSEFGAFFIITLISGVIQIGIAALIFAMDPLFSMSPQAWGNIGKIVGITIASAWNFVGYKFLVFKK